jgi:SAM-dependent methyltransferase
VDATRASYDAVAQRYAKEIGDELERKPFDRALLTAFNEYAPVGVVADVGCGPGQLGYYINAMGRATIGLDLSPGMCRVGAELSLREMPFAAMDMRRLGLVDACLAGIICGYALIHLDEAGRAQAYRDFARVLTINGALLVSFHVRDGDVDMGGVATLREWWDQPVDLTFRYLDPDVEAEALRRAGFRIEIQAVRQPIPEAEHPSERAYLVARRVTPA